MPADIDRHIQEAAWIVPQIEHQRLHPLLLQFVERFRQFLRRRFVELNQADVPDLERPAQLGVEQLGSLHALHLYFRAFEGVIFDLLRGGTQNGQRYFLPGCPAQKINGILQIHFLGRVAVDPQNLVAGQNAGLGRGRIFHRRDNGEQAALHRHFDAETVEPAPGVILHVLEVVRIHELTVWVERREHAFHRGVNQVVVAGLVAIHVILPEQLDRFGENRNLRIPTVVITAGGVRGVEPDAEQNVEEEQARDGAEQKTAFHLDGLSGPTMIAHTEIFGNAQSVV